MLKRFAGGRGFDGRDVERAVEDVCECDVTPLFEAHVRRGGGPIEFDRYLGLLGLRTRVSWAPAVSNGQPERDLRIFGWEPPGDSSVRLIISDAGSIWGRAGLHTGDRLISVDGRGIATWPDLRARLQELRIGDTIRLEVGRPSAAGSFRAAVTVTGFERPVVRIEELPGATAQQRALRNRWLRGEP
jgi:predicted metalloprotease with PDZ domain